MVFLVEFTPDNVRLTEFDQCGEFSTSRPQFLYSDDAEYCYPFFFVQGRVKLW
jgi:hypothetical protein